MVHSACSEETNVGTAAPGCPAEQSSASVPKPFPAKAALARARGIPHPWYPCVPSSVAAKRNPERAIH